MKTTIELVYLDNANNYLDRLSSFLAIRGEKTTPEMHKQVIMNRGKSNEFKSKFTRPYVAFEYSIRSKYTRCFPLGTFKSGKDNLTDPRFFFIVGLDNKIKGKVILTKPTFIPTKYLKVINFKREIALARKFANVDLSRWLSNLNIERIVCRKQSIVMLNRNNLIKNGRVVNGVNYKHIKDKYYINERLVYNFCEMELVESES